MNHHETARPSSLMDREKNQRFVGAFAAKHRERLIRRFMKLGETEQDAQDLVHEALKRLIETFDSVESHPNERVCASWLSTTLTNLFRDHLRKRRTRKNALPKLLASAVETSPDETADREPDTSSFKQLTQAIDELPPAARAALRLKAEGKSGRQIAEALHIREGTARKRVADAMKKVTVVFRRLRSPGGH